MDVRAVFELPVYIWLMREALDQIYPTGFGQLRFTVVMPTEGSPVDESPTTGPPAIEGIESHAGLGSDDVEWAQEYGAFIPESLKPATALLRIGITDVDGPTYGHMSWFTPEHQLAEYVTPWFDNVRTWVEIITGQDLDPNHRVYDANPVGAGLTFIEPPNDSALGVQISTSSVRPLRASEWSRILELVRDGVEPPPEEVLSRDARAAQRRGADRRAVIDAATALEIVLGRHVRSLIDQLPENQQKRITDRAALGDYISIAEHSGLQLAVDVDRLRWVSKLRNEAAHRGLAPTNWDAGTAVQLVIDFLGAHGPYRRTGEREPDGSEWIVADPPPQKPDVS
ncbi:MAG: hypothetical protein KAG80_13310 [Nocardioides sp.]|nr:hypothetical protein [Nocardioides sp.]